MTVKKRFVKFIAFIFSIFLISSNCYSNNADPFQGVNLQNFENQFNIIRNYPLKRTVYQNELTPPSIYSFVDNTHICKVEIENDDYTRMNKIAITLDDSFIDKYTEEILDVLDKHNCKVTFFITYALIKNNPERIYEIINRGHEIANHSMTHPPFKGLNPIRQNWELATLNIWAKELTNVNISLCRFPSGSYDKNAINTACSLGLYPIGWSIDSYDWKYQNTNKVLANVAAQNLTSGSILLFHNGYGFSKDMFDKLLSYYDMLGFSYLKVSDLIYTTDFIVEKGVQRKIKQLMKRIIFTIALIFKIVFSTYAGKPDYLYDVDFSNKLYF